MENDLGVALPLHISLSRPLALKTEQKDAFLSRVQKGVEESSVTAFHVVPKDVAWHSNEKSTRSFMVMRLQRSKDQEMMRLLEVCNGIANDFEQPLLYAGKDERGGVQSNAQTGDKFHISLAWSLRSPDEGAGGAKGYSRMQSDDAGVPYQLLGRLSDLNIAFTEVKVRIGQDVYTVPLKVSRRKMSAETMVHSE